MIYKIFKCIKNFPSKTNENYDHDSSAAVLSLDLKVVVVNITSVKNTDPRRLLGWSFRVGESVHCRVLY